jgi:predicted DNA-binding transcriptional regulator AlpA
MSDNDNLKLLTRKDVSELFQLPVSTLDYYIVTEQVPFVRLGKRNIRFCPDKLLQWLKERENVPYRKNKATESPGVSDEVETSRRELYRIPE